MKGLLIPSKETRVGEGGYHPAPGHSGDSLRSKDFEELAEDYLWAYSILTHAPSQTSDSDGLMCPEALSTQFLLPPDWALLPVPVPPRMDRVSLQPSTVLSEGRSEPRY